jgi:hypothetical protein
MQKKPSPLVAADLNLPAGDEFVAARTDSPFIERRPFPPGVSRSQNVEAIFWGEMLLHACMKGQRLSFRNRSGG